MRMRLTLWLVFLLLLFNCKKEDSVVGIVNIEVDYAVEGDLLLFDTIQYLNDAGNNYGVTRLEYYISAITFLQSDVVKFRSDGIYYINARTPSTNSFSLTEIPEGDYDSIEFTLGLNPEDNLSNSLPNTTENLNMAWPDVMGGGYHFMKLEGHFTDSTGGTPGFAMHLGENGNAVKIKLTGISVPVRKNTPVSLQLRMNVNEWYRNPAVYDFNTDGNYSMGVMAAMQKLAANGTDVFTATIR